MSVFKFQNTEEKSHTSLYVYQEQALAAPMATAHHDIADHSSLHVFRAEAQVRIDAMTQTKPGFNWSDVVHSWRLERRPE